MFTVEETKRHFVRTSTSWKHSIFKLPWWSSGWDSSLSMQGAQVQSLVWRVRIPHATWLLLQSRRRLKHSVQFSSVPQSCPTLCDPMDCSTPGLPVHHQLPELTQTHVPRVGDAIQPSHPLSSPSPPTFNLSQHQGFFPMSRFFASGGQSIGVSCPLLALFLSWSVCLPVDIRSLTSARDVPFLGQRRGRISQDWGNRCKRKRQKNKMCSTKYI